MNALKPWMIKVGITSLYIVLAMVEMITCLDGYYNVAQVFLYIIIFASVLGFISHFVAAIAHIIGLVKRIIRHDSPFVSIKAIILDIVLIILMIITALLTLIFSPAAVSV